MVLPNRLRNSFAGLAFGVLMLSPDLAPACQIPVFRYALERWQPAAYEVVVFHRGPLSAADQAAVDGLGDVGKTLANLVMTDADLSRPLDKALKKVWEAQSGKAEPALPWAVILYPDDPAAGPLWAGPPAEASAHPLLDSPARREVARRLLGGQSAVWVLVEGGDEAKDEVAAKSLEQELEAQQKALVLPDLDLGAPGPRLLSELPLKVGFSALRVSRSDDKERAFVAMLTHGLKPQESPEPVLVPVFGQGRALCVLQGKEIEPGQVGQIATFLTGACSCQVKELNPGFDLLMAADWQSLVEGRPAVEPGAGEAAGAPTTRPAARAVGASSTTRPPTRPTVTPPYVAAASLPPAVGAPSAGQAPAKSEPVAVYYGEIRLRTLLVAGTAVMAAIVLLLGGLLLRSKSRNGGVR